MTSSWFLGFINIDNFLVFPSANHIAENTICSATPDRSSYFAQLAWPMIGASLSEPHTSGTVLRRYVCIYTTDRPTDRACGHIL